MSEETIYSGGNVSVTTSRIAVGATTYALRNITSVKMGYSPAKRGCPIILLFLAFLAVLIGTAAALLNSDFSMFIGGFAWTLIFGVIGFFWLRSAKDAYHVVIASSSGEANAVTSKEKKYIETIVSAINEAIVRYR